MSNKPKDRTLKLEKNRKNKRSGEGRRDPVKKAMDKLHKPATHKNKKKLREIYGDDDE